MNKPTVTELKDGSKYKLVRKLRFSEILSFVIENIRIYNIYTIFYFLINILFLIIVVSLSIQGFKTGDFSLGRFLSITGSGFLAGSFLIIPVHEGLHALAFLIIGARKIKFGADLRQMIFYATAEDFVAGRKGFSLVAWAPFAVINAAGILTAIGSGINVLLFIFVTLFLHNIMCIGDFAMLSFFRKNSVKEMFSFDEFSEKTAWFYEKIK